MVCGKVVLTAQSDQQTFLGSVEPIRRSTVGSAVDGRVLEIMFDVGDPVGAAPDSTTSRRADGETSPFQGQSLVQLRTQTLEIERETSRLQAQQRAQELEELRISLPRDIELADAALAGAKARLKYSQANFERLQKMSGNRGAVSVTELDEARSAFDSDQQAVIAATADFEKLRSTKDLRIKQAENLLATAQQETTRLNDLKIKYTIRAPFEGVVTRKLTEVGSWVTRGAPLFEVVQLNPIEIVVRVPQKYIGQVQQSLANAQHGLTANLTFDSLEQPLTGTVVRVVPQADLQTRSFPVRIRLENPKLGDSHLIKPGMLGRASLGVGEPVEMMMVNKDSLVLGGSQPKVYKVERRDGKDIAVSVDVTTGASIGNWIQVFGDLQADDTVVVEGNERLRPNQILKVLDIRKETVTSTSS